MRLDLRRLRLGKTDMSMDAMKSALQQLESGLLPKNSTVLGIRLGKWPPLLQAMLCRCFACSPMLHSVTLIRFGADLHYALEHVTQRHHLPRHADDMQSDVCIAPPAAARRQQQQACLRWLERCRASAGCV